MLKKILFVSIFVITAITSVTHAEDDMKTVASKAYVDTQIETKQLKIPAANQPNVGAGETVMTYTATGNGQIGERGLYSDISSYDATTDGDKLITASALNATFTNLPTTPTTKLECANQSDGCTLWTIVDQTAYGDMLPSGYTRLEYIESTGTQYIDTGIYGTEHHGMEIKYSYPTLDGAYSGRLCGGRTGGTSTNAFAYIGTYIGTLTPANNTFYVTSNNGLSANLQPIDTNVHTASVNLSNNQKSYFDGQEIQGTGETTAYVHQFTTNLFRAYNGAYGWATPARARIYFCKITNSGELVRDFIPAKNSNNELGMYDLVSGQFFANQGTGDFVAGPVAN